MPMAAPPVTGAMPMVAPAGAMPMAAPTARPSGALGSGTFGMMPEPVNNLAPAPAAPSNALVAPVGKTPDQLRKEIMLFGGSNAPGAKNMVDMLKAQLTESLKQTDTQREMQVLGLPPTPEGFRQYKALSQAPTAPPSMVAEYTFAKTPDGGNFRGSYQDFVTARAAAGRAPVQPVAPTITQIVDPTNPNQMITIDARRYQGGGAGSPGVIGVSGKEPSAALRENKTEAGKTQLADDLENLRFSFQKLDSLRAIPSTERNALSNVTSGLASTAIGQRTGQLFATEAQVERDVINSARSRLVNSIKNATGMSAQQLNSNVELQTMLKSISDPGQSYQSAIRIIEDIEDAYVKGKGMKKRGEPAPAPAPGASQGTGGFKYLGKESTK